jgi:hypothetical protein
MDPLAAAIDLRSPVAQDEIDAVLLIERQRPQWQTVGVLFAEQELFGKRRPLVRRVRLLAH